MFHDNDSEVFHETVVPDLASYKWIVINLSGGKDSEAMLFYVVSLADALGVPRSRIVAVYADLGRVVWGQTREYAEAQAGMLGVRFEVVRREKGDLLEYVLDKNARRRAEGKTGGKAVSWPSGGARWCTSDLKISPVTTLITRLVNEADPAPDHRLCILNCVGIRAEESAKRKMKTVFAPDPANWRVTPLTAKPARPATRTGPADPGREERKGIPHGRREVDRWLPVFHWTASEVWDEIRHSRLPWHWAYQYVDRVSCPMCFGAGFDNWALAAYLVPELAADYLDAEIRTGTTFTTAASMAQVIAAAKHLPPPLSTLPWDRTTPVRRS
ncbi:hypothetical protein ALI22I_20570 [Saccharothrix sp. ALI-22-I]|nr:hypothetical protein ALI22I_20570 [Saccharothrix sp. ALI-22-I]